MDSLLQAPSVHQIGSRAAMSDAGIVEHYVEERRASTAELRELRLRSEAHRSTAAWRPCGRGPIPERMACTWRLQQGIRE